MGGGSSNAATTLLALNHLWGLELTLDALLRIGEPMGADVPVFIHGQNAWAEGIGGESDPPLTAEAMVCHRPAKLRGKHCRLCPSRIDTSDPADYSAGLFSGLVVMICQPLSLTSIPKCGSLWNGSESIPKRENDWKRCLCFASVENEQKARNIAEQAPAGLAVIVAEAWTDCLIYGEVT